ncbi:MP200 [Mycoplasmoides pneumoniae M129]|nr:MP200 [Mycoplasmoides pneumoniae M129]
MEDKKCCGCKTETANCSKCNCGGCKCCQK